MDWHSVFSIETPLLELFTRSTAMYFGLLFLLRVLPRRTGGEMASMDLVFILLIAEAAAHSLGTFHSLGDSLVVVATLIAWNMAVNYLSYRVPAFERLFSPAPLQVIRDGELQRRNMRREFLTKEELMEHLHAHGIDEVSDVKAAWVESDGKLTVIRRDKKAHGS